jgi:hypothetical protein
MAGRASSANPRASYSQRKPMMAEPIREPQPVPWKVGEIEGIKSREAGV